MKKKRVFVTCGPSGCGKSTWVQKQLALHGGNWISRDLIRLSMVEDSDAYFSWEDTVLEEFYATIDMKLKSEHHHTDIYIDATHLTPKARRELFRHINKEYVKEFIALSFEIPLETALQRNANRVGRADVPATVIRDMVGRFIKPIKEEGFNEIWHINAEGTINKEV